MAFFKKLPDGFTTEPEGDASKASGTNAKQVGGSHYKKAGDYQHWDMVKDARLDYFRGQATKYLVRHADKNGKQDLEKCKHYLEKLQEVMQRDPGYLMGEVQPNALEAAIRFIKVSGMPRADATLLVYIFCVYSWPQADMAADMCQKLIDEHYGDEAVGAPTARYTNQDA